MFLFSIKFSYLLTAKITPDVNYFHYILKTVPQLGDSAYVRQDFWYLIMASTKLI